MKVAVISSVPLFPTTEGNRRRVCNFVRSLAKLGHEVHFVLLPVPMLVGIDMEMHRREPAISHFTALRRTLPETLWHRTKRVAALVWHRFQRALGLAGRHYNFLDEYFYTGSLPQLRRLAAEHDFDAVIVEYVFNTRAFEAFPERALRVLDTHDSFGDRHLLFGPNPTSDQYWYSIPIEEEVRAMRRADVVIAIQEEEAELFRDRLGDMPPQVITVSHTLELDDVITDYAPRGAVFIGSKATPNVSAMTHFLEEILPKIVAVMPDFRLHVAGRICELLPEHPNLIQHGRVLDVADIFRLAPLSINPMLVGTGINIKLLDAMSHGVATVSSAIGVRGLGAEFTRGVVVVPDGDATAFADAVLRLLGEESERAALGRQALAAAQEWNRKQLTALASIEHLDRIDHPVACHAAAATAI